MNKGRRRLNISLIVLSILLAGWAVWIYRQPSPSHTEIDTTAPPALDSAAKSAASDMVNATIAHHVTADSIRDTSPSTSYIPSQYSSSAENQDSPRRKASTRIEDADVRYLSSASHPFASEARKVLSGQLEESDSISRHRILSYCEHLRTSYTTRDIDFLRQVFSDNALIIVGHTVRTSDASSPKGSQKTIYSIRSKREYLDRLAKIFDSGNENSLKFSDFHIMRHPTMKGIYGVTLRQQYASGNYADDGWLFLLWDFRDPSMPLIHVRTWQPTSSLSGEEDIIDMSDFNLE